MAKKNKSTSKENEAISNPEITNQVSIKNLKKSKSKQLDISSLIQGVLKQDIASLSKAITLIESKNTAHLKHATTLLNKCLPHSNQSIRIGITGVPGVGKSSFIEVLGNHLISLGKRVAVLAIDPSSSVTKGSILGDKTRMETLAKNPNAFIRPSATGDTLGGVARKTRETIILCEAAGFDVIIIETVGVGQSETVVHSMVDFFLLLQLAGAGDELQGIKRGIIEMADAIAINKADRNNIKAAKLAASEFSKALHLYPKKPSGWQPKVTVCSALNNEGVTDIWQIIEDYIKTATKNNHLIKKRNDQNKFWLLETIKDALTSQFFDRNDIKQALNEQLNRIENNKTTPFEAANYLLQLKSK